MWDSSAECTVDLLMSLSRADGCFATGEHLCGMPVLSWWSWEEGKRHLSVCSKQFSFLIGPSEFLGEKKKPTLCVQQCTSARMQMFNKDHLAVSVSLSFSEEIEV